MNLILAVYAAVFGVFAGVFLAGAIGRWAYAIWTTVRARHVGGSEHKTRPLMWALPVVLILHSTPWLLVIAGYLSYQLFSHPHASWWLWFYGGLAASAVLMAALLLHTRSRQHQSAPKREDIGRAA